MRAGLIRCTNQIRSHKGGSGWSLVESAAMLGMTNLVAELLETDIGSDKLLGLAAKNERLDTMRYLIERGVNPFKGFLLEDKTKVEELVKRGKEDAYHLLMQARNAWGKSN